MRLIRRAIVGMATTTAGNFGMAVGVALLRFSGDPSRPESFHVCDREQSTQLLVVSGSILTDCLGDMYS